MDFIRELGKLERIVSKEQWQMQNMDQLHDKDMDLSEFLLCNFVVKHNDQFEVDHEKIGDTLPHLQLMQQRTCEDIAISVDMNLDQYVLISQRLQSLKDKLALLQQQYECVEQDIELTRDTLEDKIGQIGATLDNLKLIDVVDRNLNTLKEVVGRVQAMQGMLVHVTQSECDSQTLMLCYQLMTTRTTYHHLVDICVHCRQLCGRYSILTQLTALTQHLQNHLEQQCVARLLQPDTHQLAIIFQCFFVLQQPKLPEKLIVQFIIKPQLDALYDELLRNKTTMLKNDSVIENFSESVLAINRTQGQSIEATLALLPTCPFQFKQMLMELVYIYLSQKDCAFVYSVGVPDTFHRNYHTLQSLKQKLNIDNVKQLELEKRFYDKWNLNSYFSVRYNQIVRSYEQGMEEQFKNIKKYVDEQSAQPLITFKLVLIKHIQSCISKQVFIKTIGSKFIRLVLQLINRFCAQIGQFKDSISEEQTQLSNDVTVNLCEAWKETSEHLHELTPHYPLESVQAVQEVIRTKLFNLTCQFIDLTIIPITNQCFQNLEPFNGVPAKFRMTNREAPTKPSNFTGNIFRPLQTYLSKTTLHDTVQQLMMLKVAQQVFARYQQVQDQVIDGCSKQEQLMQKLGVSTNKESDYHKIQQQFKLDQEEILNTIQQKFGIQRDKIIQ